MNPPGAAPSGVKCGHFTGQFVAGHQSVGALAGVRKEPPHLCAVPKSHIDVTIGHGHVLVGLAGDTAVPDLVSTTVEAVDGQPDDLVALVDKEDREGQQLEVVHRSELVGAGAHELSLSSPVFEVQAYQPARDVAAVLDVCAELFDGEHLVVVAEGPNLSPHDSLCAPEPLDRLGLDATDDVAEYGGEHHGSGGLIVQGVNQRINEPIKHWCVLTACRSETPDGESGILYPKYVKIQFSHL